MSSFLENSDRPVKPDKISLSMFGSCAVHDIFRLHPDDGGYQIEQFENFISPLSMTGEPNPMKPEELEALLEPMEAQNFIKRNKYLDQVKDYWGYFGKKTSDYFLLDISNLRFPIDYDEIGRYYTACEAQADLTAQMVKAGIYHPIRQRTPEEFTEEEIREAVSNLTTHLLKQYRPEQIILVELHPAQEYYNKNYEVMSFLPRYAERWNIAVYERVIGIAFKILRELLPTSPVIPFPKGVMADAHHKWGIHVLHYQSQYYRYALEAVRLLTAGNPTATEKIDELKRETEQQVFLQRQGALTRKPVKFATELGVESFYAPYLNDIPADSDLNAIVKPGAYRCRSGKEKSSMKHFPESFTRNVGFRLTVKQIAAISEGRTALIQTLEPNLPDVPVYRRYYYGEAQNKWGPWYRLVTDQELSSLEKELAVLKKKQKQQEKTLKKILDAFKGILQE
jgi:hypothetical protein